MPRPAAKLSKKLTARLARVGRVRGKYEDLCQREHITDDELEDMYETWFLQSHLAFESFLENLFIGLLVGRLTADRSIRPRIQVRSDRVAREVIFAGKDYVDWMPFNSTKNRAEPFFRGGRPFDLSEGDCTLLAEVQRIRNFIVHGSSHAERQYLKILDAHRVGVGRRKAGTFLRRHKTVGPPPETWFEYYLKVLGHSAHRLCGE